MKRSACALALVAAVAFACSSAPRRQDEVFDLRNKAAEAARFGNDYYRGGDLDQALRTAQDIGDAALAAKAENNLGETAFARGEFAAALELFVKAGGAGGLTD